MDVKKSILLALVVLVSYGTKAQSSLHFDGGDEVTCGEFFPTGDYTKEAWIQLSSSGTPNNFISGDSPTNGHFFWAGSFSSGKLSAGHFVSGVLNQVQDPGAALSLNQWYHVAVTFESSSSTMKLYKNGELVAQTTSIAAHGDATCELGTFASANFLTGTLDEVRIWNDVRTKAELNQHMNCELEGSEGGLVAYYPLNEGTPSADNSSITVIEDNAGSNDGSMSGFAKTGSTSNWVTSADYLKSITATAISAASTSLNCGETTSINVVNSDASVSYYLRDNLDNSIVNGPLSGNGGTLSIGTVSNTKNTTYNVVGVVRGGEALEFDGASDYATVIDHPNFDWGSGEGAISLWFKTSTSATGDRIMAIKGGLGASERRYALIYNSGAVYFEMDDNSSNPKVGGTTTGLNDGAWHHVLGTKQGDSLYIYVDGSLDQLADVTGLGSVDATDAFHMGAGTGGTQHFEGAIDELLIFNTGFTSSEGVELFVEGLTSSHPNYSDLQIGYNFEGGALPEISDQGPDGTTSGSPSTVAGNGKLCSKDMTGSPTVSFNYNTVINEVITDPQQDWSSTGFSSAPGGTAGSDDEWVEIYIGCANLDFTGWTIELNDASPVTGDLTATGAFDVSNYTTSGSGTFTQTESGDYLVLGNVDGSGSMNNTSLTVVLKDAEGYTVDEVTLGGGVSEAPSGNATGVTDEAVARIPNGGDTDDDDIDFATTIATIGADNSPTGTIVINELVTDPFTDWSSNDFDGTDGESVVSDVDEWVELLIKSDGLNLTGWTIELNDASPVTGDLTENVSGAFQVVNYISKSSGSSWYNTADGDYVVLGNVRGGSINNTGTYLIKDAYGTTIDQVILGGGNAPNGASTSFNDEAIARIPNGTDTDNDNSDFIQSFPTLGAINVTDTISENRGNMVSFDGSGDYIDFGDAEEHDFGSSDFSLELWFKTDASSGYACLLDKGFTASAPMYYLFVNGTDGAIATRILDNSGNGITQTERGSGYNDNEWHHLALTVDRTNDVAKIYVDGNQAGTDIDISSVTGAIDPTEDLYLGMTSTSSSHSLSGSIDEVCIWNDLRTQSEIRCHRHLTLNGDESNLQGYWQFNNAGSTIADAINGNDGTLSGNAVRATSEVHVGSGISTKHTTTAFGTYSSTSSLSEHSLDIIFSSAHPNGELVVSYITEDPVGGQPGSKWYKNQGTWIINNYGSVTSGLNYSVRFNYPDGSIYDVGTAALNTYSLWKRETNATGSWSETNSAANSTSATAGSNYVQFDGLGSFSMLAATSSVSPLPVDLISFTGTHTAQGVILDWATASEKSSDYFEVWSSDNNTDFELITKIPAAGNSSSLLSYSYTDAGSLRGTHYYKLIQVDMDGTRNEYDPISVSVLEESGLLVVESPEGHKVIAFGGQLDTEVAIYDITGSLVTELVPNDTNTWTLLSRDLPSGMLFASSLINGKGYTTKFVNP